MKSFNLHAAVFFFLSNGIVYIIYITAKRIFVKFDYLIFYKSQINAVRILVFSQDLFVHVI